MHECLQCGFSCGTLLAFQRHAERSGHQTNFDIHAAAKPSQKKNAQPTQTQNAAAAESSAQQHTDIARCNHIGTERCGCSKYHVLGVRASITEHELRDALKRLTLEWHPDRTLTAAWQEAHPGVTTAAAAEEFKKIRRAYEQLVPLVALRSGGGHGNAAPADAPHPLIDAVKAGPLAAVRDLLDAIGDEAAAVTALDAGGMDALSWACRLGRTQIVELLLERRHQLQAESESLPSGGGGGGTMYAGSPDSTESHISSTALALETVPSLWAAAAGGDGAIVSMLLGSHAAAGRQVAMAVNEQEPLLKHSGLHTAADRGHAAVVAQLLQAAADVTAVDGRGYSALSVASFKGHTAVVEQLLDANADVTLIAEGDAPLTLACRRGRLEVARLLLRRGATADGRCVAQARAKGHDDILELLREYGCR